MNKFNNISKKVEKALELMNKETEEIRKELDAVTKKKAEKELEIKSLIAGNDVVAYSRANDELKQLSSAVEFYNIKSNVSINKYMSKDEGNKLLSEIITKQKEISVETKKTVNKLLEEIMNTILAADSELEEGNELKKTIKDVIFSGESVSNTSRYDDIDLSGVYEDIAMNPYYKKNHNNIPRI